MMPSEKVFYPGGGGMNSDPLLFYYMCFNLLLSSVTVLDQCILKKNPFDWLIDFSVYKCIYMHAKHPKVWTTEKIINLRIETKCEKHSKCQWFIRAYVYHIHRYCAYVHLPDR